jgi:hypothetical protein
MSRQSEIGAVIGQSTAPITAIERRDTHAREPQRSLAVISSLFQARIPCKSAALRDTQRRIVP